MVNRRHTDLATFLDYDDSTQHGSREHFFHFMWGYLLPALHWLTEDADAPRRDIHMITCGPVMDRVTREACDLVGVRPRIEVAHPQHMHRVSIPRWDLVLLEQGRAERDRRGLRARARRLKSLVLGSSRNPAAKARLRDIQHVRAAVHRLRERVTAQAAAAFVPDPALKDRILLLRRSDMPRYYAADGAAEIKGYGTARRSLNGIDEAVKALERRGLPVATFEPGAASFAEQVSAFANAAGIVGIRGAEFANLVWMAPGRRILMVTPQEMKDNQPPFPQGIAQMTGVDLVEETTPGGKEHATLQPEDVARVFSHNVSPRLDFATNS